MDVTPSKALIRQNAEKINHYQKTLRSHLALFHGKPFKGVAWTITTAVLDIYLELHFSALLLLLCFSAERQPCKIHQSLLVLVCRTGNSEHAACAGDENLGVMKDSAVKHLCHTNSKDMLELQQPEDL